MGGLNRLLKNKSLQADPETEYLVYSALKSDDEFLLQEAYSKLFKVEPPCIMMMQGLRSYKKELKNALRKRRKITDDMRPDCDVIWEEDEINLENKYNN